MNIQPDKNHDVLIVVDMQKDFITGSMAVEGGVDIIPHVNELIQKFRDAECRIVYTMDWHPFDHMSFKEQGGPWPQHCVVGTIGSDIHDDILRGGYAKEFFIHKGVSPLADSYSGFRGTYLPVLLRTERTKRTFICGIAGEYCVFETALDSSAQGYETYVISRAIASVSSEGAAKAFHALRHHLNVQVIDEESISD